MNQGFGTILPAGGRVDARASTFLPAHPGMLLALREAAAEAGESSRLAAVFQSATTYLCSDLSDMYKCLFSTNSWAFQVPSSHVEEAQQGPSFAGFLEYEMRLRSHFVMCPTCDCQFFSMDDTLRQCASCARWATYNECQKRQSYRRCNRI